MFGSLRPIAFVLLLALAGLAQCGPVGGGADLRSTPMAIGGPVTLSLSGEAGAPFGIDLSLGSGPTAIPGLGTICLDLSPGLFLGEFLSGSVPPGGELALPFTIPPDPGLLNFLLYAQGAVVGTNGISVTRALRIDFQVPDSTELLPSLSSPRVLHTANLLSDNRVLIAGGGAGGLLGPVGLDTTELYDPVTRTISPGPTMSVARAFHTATTLQDGRVLIAGGVLGNTGIVTQSCEIYDPATGTMTPAASMSTVRSTHAAVLLQDGRVLVAGGTTTFVGGGAAALGPILNATLNTAEVFDPTAGPLGSWTPVSNTMSSRRFLPGAARLSDGRALIVSGLSGTNFLGIPNWTTSCDFYDPVGNIFFAAPNIPSARSGAGVAVLPNGDVFFAGGAVSGFLSIPTISDTSYTFVASTAWIPGPTLPTPVVLPAAKLLPNGLLLLAGGVGGTLFSPSAVSDMSIFDGVNLFSLAPLPAPQAALLSVPLPDGSVFLCGGTDPTANAVATNLIYTPNP